MRDDTKRLWDTALFLISLGLTGACLLFAFGCSSANQKVLTYDNAFHYVRVVHVSKCPQTPIPDPDLLAGCKESYAAMADMQKWSAELAAAVKRGGSFPLQLKAMGAAEKRALAALEAIK